MRAAALAGCSQVEHGVFATAEVLALFSQRGTWYDPQCSLVFRNYLDNRPKFEGIGNYNPEGSPPWSEPFRWPGGVQAGARDAGTQLAYGTDAVAGAHGRNAEDLVCRVQEGPSPWRPWSPPRRSTPSPSVR
jgi:imidazolonepropionase-like amidohydrolase